MCCVSRSVVSDSATSWTHPPGSTVHGDSPDKNTAVGSYFLFQEILPTQESNLGLLHCRQILYCLNHAHDLLTKNKVGLRLKCHNI